MIQPAFEARNEPKKAALLLLFMVLLVPISLWFTFSDFPPALFLGWLGIVAFPLATVRYAFRMFDRRPMIRVDSDGVFFREWTRMPVPWSAITKVQAGRIYGHLTLSVWMIDPKHWRKQTLAVQIARLSSLGGHAPLQIRMIGLDRDFADLVAAVKAHWPPMASMDRSTV